MTERIFHPVPETEISRAIAGRFASDMEAALSADVFIIGGGPAGLTAGRRLALEGQNVFIIERNNFLGGGFWVGGYFMNTVTFRSPAERVLDDVGIPHEKAAEGLHVTPGPLACGHLIAAAAEAGVRFLQLTRVEDLIVKDGGVKGVVVNWSPAGHLPKGVFALDPIALESRYVLDATGHDATGIALLAKRGLLELKGMGTHDVEASEDAVVERTGEVFPGLVAAGMAVSELYGLSRMGPTFGAMLLSGERAAEIILEGIAVAA